MATRVMGKPFQVTFRGKLKSAACSMSVLTLQMQSEYFIIPPSIAKESLEAAGYNVAELISIRRGGQIIYERD